MRVGGKLSEVRDHRKVLFQPIPSSDLKQENVHTGELRLKVHFKLFLDKQYETLSPSPPSPRKISADAEVDTEGLTIPSAECSKRPENPFSP